MLQCCMHCNKQNCSFFIVCHLTMMMMSTRIFATQLCLMHVPLLAVCFGPVLQRLLWCTTSMFSVVDPDFLWQCNALSGNRSPSILVTCPNHVSRRILFVFRQNKSSNKITRYVDSKRCYKNSTSLAAVAARCIEAHLLLKGCL